MSPWEYSLNSVSVYESGFTDPMAEVQKTVEDTGRDFYDYEYVFADQIPGLYYTAAIGLSEKAEFMILPNNAKLDIKGEGNAENKLYDFGEAIQEIKENPAPYACSGVIDGSFIFAGLAFPITGFVIWGIATSRKEKAGQ